MNSFEENLRSGADFVSGIFDRGIKALDTYWDGRTAYEQARAGITYQQRQIDTAMQLAKLESGGAGANWSNPNDPVNQPASMPSVTSNQNILIFAALGLVAFGLLRR